MAQNSKRGRHNNNRRRQGGNNLNRSIDSTGPEVKIRGTAAQIFEKYQGLARDAYSAGDRIRAESLSQHAEHYFRLMKAMQADTDRRDDRGERSDQRHESNAIGHDDDGDFDTDDRGHESSADDHSGRDEPEMSGEEEENAPAEAADMNDAEGEASPARPRRARRRRAPRRGTDSDGNEVADTTEPAPAD